jgi:hypothetical protein
VTGYTGSSRDVGFSDHACEQFIRRAGLPDLSIHQARGELEDLNWGASEFHDRHPSISDKRWRGAGLKDFPCYLVLDGWILCGLRPSKAGVDEYWTVVTVVTLGDVTWKEALARGITNRPCPTPLPVHASWSTGFDDHDDDTVDYSPPRHVPRARRVDPQFSDAPSRIDLTGAEAAGMLVIFGLAILLGVAVGASPDVLGFGRPGGLITGIPAAALTIILWGHIRLLDAGRLGMFAAICALIAAALASNLDPSPSEVRQGAVLVAWIAAFVPLWLTSSRRYDSAVRAAVAVLAIELAGIVAIASS